MAHRGEWISVAFKGCRGHFRFARVLALCLSTLLGLWTKPASAACDSAGFCCAGQNVYLCKADGSADVSYAPSETCSAAGCTNISEWSMTGCVGNGTSDWAHTSFCTNNCQAGCTGLDCPGTCASGTLCVHGACQPYRRGVISDWRLSAWGYASSTAAPDSGLHAMCSTATWSAGIKMDNTLTYWGTEPANVPLFANAANIAITDAQQIACADTHLLVLRSDGTVTRIGATDPYMPTGLSGIKSIAASQHSNAVVRQDGSITVWGAPDFVTFYYSGDPSFQKVLNDNQGSAGYVSVAGQYYSDAGYMGVKSDGTVVVAGRTLDNHGWNPTPPAQVTGVVSAAISLVYAMALKQDGSVVVWDTGNNIVANPPGLKPCVAVAVLYQVPVALQVDGTIAVWGNSFGGTTTIGKALIAALATVHNAFFVDQTGLGVLTDDAPCGAVSALGCCNGDQRYWCDATGLKSEACAAGTCGWQTHSSHFCDTHCGGAAAGCYCDSLCGTYGDCCNADGTGAAGNSCGGSVCGACSGGISAFAANEYQCTSAGGSAPGGGEVPLRSCVCVPSCTGKQCGSDGCGGSCDKGSCDDGNPCTQADKCSGEACVGTPKNCDDGNPCTTDACSVQNGQPACENTNSTDPCTDGNACTVGDTCAGGACGPGTGSLACDDANPCTDDSCVPATGCVFANNSAACSDGNACTTGDVCASGSCAGPQPVDCDDGNPCTDDSCDAAVGCKHAPNAATCDDHSNCTSGDTCTNGKCSGTGVLSCDDGNPCTSDDCLDATTCAPKTNSPDGSKCADGSACHLPGTCQSGQCAGMKNLDCDDKNPCTDDSCDSAKGCTHANNTAPCNDGNACTSGDTCAAGACVPGGPLASCDDKNPCTDDCDPSSGCVKIFNTAACDDGSVCTQADKCSAGTCVGSSPKTCDDGNPCTFDNCNALAGCQHSFRSAACDDGNSCTTGDYCWQGSCTGGAAPGCDDGNACTSDACDPAKGCFHKNSTAPCDDKNACTLSDVCVGGTCTPGKSAVCNDSNPCTTDSCNPTLGCVFTPNQLACNDGNACTVNDTCAGGACKGIAKSCDDGNPCSDDTCDATGACTHTNNTASCDDANPCTVADKCGGGTCAGSAKCDDGNPCTTDVCTPTVQTSQNGAGSFASSVLGVCSQVPHIGATCSDGDPCTTADACGADGKCAGAALCLGGTCSAVGGVGKCACATGQTLVANGAYQSCCTPMCTGKKCGSDGCGGSCGSCTSEESCSADGASCQPKVACYGKAPTDHGCCDGRVLKHCAAPSALSSVDCAATGQFCGWSATLQDYACTNTGLSAPSGGPAFTCPKAATCVANCTNRSCGPDGCGGQCPNQCAATDTCSPLDGKCISTICGGAVPPGGCVENLTTNKPTVSMTGTYGVSTAHTYYGCGCPSGNYDASGNCLFKPDPNYPSSALVGTNCLIRTCTKNSDGTSSIANAGDVSCPNGILWNNIPGAWQCVDNANTTPSKQFLNVVTKYTDPWGVGHPSGVSDTVMTNYTTGQLSWPIKAQACSAFPLAGGCKFPMTKVCGDDGAGGSCGTCPSGQQCKPDGSACYTPDCGGRECGPDNNGNPCGTCATGKSCNAIGKCVTCAFGAFETCSATGTANYCGDTASHSLDCTANGGTCGPVPGDASHILCLAPAVGTCNDACVASTSSCSCDPTCVAAGTCCSNFDAKCGPSKLSAKCGNGVCESAFGENSATCAGDCASNQVCANAALLAAPYPERTDAAGTPGATTHLITPPPFDMRPAPPLIPQKGLVDYVPQAGLQLGSPRGRVNLQLNGEPGATAAAIVGVTPGMDGDGFLIDGQADAAGKLRRGAITMENQGILRELASFATGSNGGFTVAAWVKVPTAAAPLPNVLGAAQDLGYGSWDEATGLCGADHNMPGDCTKLGARPGLDEHCFTSRPDDSRIALTCGQESIADIQAYWGDAGTDVLPKDDCAAWGSVRRSSVCEDNGVTDRLRTYCVGQKTCNPPFNVIGANPCQTVSGTNPRLLVRVLCGTSPAGATLFVEGKDGSQTCPSGGCTTDAPNGRLVLNIPNGLHKSQDVYWGTGARYKPLALRSGAPVPLDTWFHVAIVFAPGNVGGDGHGRIEGRYALYLNGAEVASGYGLADATNGWSWGRGYLEGLTSSWPNAWGQMLSPAHIGDTPWNAVSNASFDELFAYRRALESDEVKQLADRPSVGALRVWPPISPAEVARDNLWTTGGQVSAIPVELSWLRDPGTCSTSASASGLVRAPFDGLHVAGSATLSIPADGADLDNLPAWTFAAWLRAPALTGSETLLAVSQGTSARVVITASPACGGHGVKARFPDGGIVEPVNCDHVLAAGEWAHIAVVQYDNGQRALFVDGAPTHASGSAPFFDPSGTGPRQLHVTAAADLGFATLISGGQARSGVASLRSTGPAVWLNGDFKSAQGAAVPVDLANFHNNTDSGAADQPTAWTISGVPLTDPLAAEAWLSVPLRGRLGPDDAQSPPPLTVAGTITIPGDPSVSLDLAQVLVEGGAHWQVRLVCEQHSTPSGWMLIPHTSRQCRFSFRQFVPGAGQPQGFDSDPIQTDTVFVAGTPVPPVDREFAFSLGSGKPSVAGANVSNGQAALAWPMPSQPGATIAIHWTKAGGPGAHNVRIWYGDALPDNLAAAASASCGSGGIAKTCEAQNRTCADTQGASSGTLFGSCGGCTGGYGDIAGECVLQRPPMSLCARNEQCSTNNCALGICQWAKTDVASCRSTCLQKGLACSDSDPTLAGQTGYFCSTWQCATDFAQAGSAVLSSQDGYDNLPNCHWTPTRQFGEICERDTQCASGGICATVAEDAYGVTASGAQTVIGKGVLDNGWAGDDWQCNGGTQTCAKANDTTVNHKRCIAPTQAFCTDLHRSAVATSGTRWDGNPESGVVCGTCLPDTLTVNGTPKPVFRKLWSQYSSALCATALNTYASKVDFLPILKSSFTTDASCTAWLKKYRNMDSVATVTRLDGTTVTVPAITALNGQTLTLKAAIAAVKANQIEGWIGHDIGGASYLYGYSADGATGVRSTTWYPQTGMAGGDGMPNQCNSFAPTGNFGGTDLLYDELDLTKLAYLLGLSGFPTVTSDLTTTQLTQLKDAGAGANLLHVLKWNETNGAKIAFSLSECLLADFKSYSASYAVVGAPAVIDVKSPEYDPRQNFTLCEYNRFANGTQCPYLATDGVTAADSMCESAFCAYDTGACEPGVSEVEENNGKSTTKQSDPLSDDIGYFGYSGGNYAHLHFGKYPYAPILASLGLPTPTNPEDDLKTPAAGGVKDRRHVQVRGQLQSTITVPVLHGIPNSDNLVYTGDPTGSYEISWTIADIDLGYTIVPGHNTVPKRVRYAPKIELFGLTLVSPDLKPIAGDACTSGTAKVCGVDKNGVASVLSCPAAGIWSASVCVGDTAICDDTSGTPICKTPTTSLTYNCASTIQNGEYNPPPPGQTACTPQRQQVSVAGGSDIKTLVPSPTGITLLDMRFPTLGGECSDALKLKSGNKPVWTQGLGVGNGIADFQACLAQTSGPKKIKCLGDLMNAFADAPGTPPTEICVKQSPVFLGPLPMVFEANAAPVLRLQIGMSIDGTTFEPAVQIRPSLGLEVSATAKFDLQEVVGIPTLMAVIKKKLPAAAWIFEAVADKISAQAGIQGELAVIEFGFPITWSLGMTQLSRTAPDRSLKKGTIPMVKGNPIEDLWQLSENFDVDLDMVLLKLSLKLFYKLGLKFLPLDPQIEKEIQLFSFSGFDFNWKIKHTPLQQWKVDFDWPGAQLIP